MVRCPCRARLRRLPQHQSLTLSHRPVQLLRQAHLLRPAPPQRCVCPSVSAALSRGATRTRTHRGVPGTLSAPSPSVSSQAPSPQLSRQCPAQARSRQVLHPALVLPGPVWRPSSPITQMPASGSHTAPVWAPWGLALSRCARRQLQSKAAIVHASSFLEVSEEL